MLHCPHCDTRHQTLETLLTCCPAELRRIVNTMIVIEKTLSGYSLTDLLVGVPMPPRLQRALNPDTPQEAA